MGQVALGEAHSCAVLEDGSARCWGLSAVGVGQLAQGSTPLTIGDTPGEAPVAISIGAERATAVAVGDGHSCALLDGGAVRCWGSNGGVLGQGTTAAVGDQPGEVPVSLPLPRPARALATGATFTCVLLVDQEVRCLGRGNNGELAQGNPQTIGDNVGEEALPVNLGAGRSVSAIAAGERHACAILDDGSVRCWGRNAFGQLGQGNTDTIGTLRGRPPWRFRWAAARHGPWPLATTTRA